MLEMVRHDLLGVAKLNLSGALVWANSYEGDLTAIALLLPSG